MAMMMMMPLTVAEVRREIVLAGQRSPVAPAQLVPGLGGRIAPTVEEEEEGEESEAKNGFMDPRGSREFHGRKRGGKREHAWSWGEIMEW